MKLSQLIILLIITLFVVGCSSQPEQSSVVVTSQEQEVPSVKPALIVEEKEDPIVTVEEVKTEEKPTEQPLVMPSNVKDFSVVAKQWEFVPAEIIVNKGDQVRLKVTSQDVTHGFNIPEYKINKQLPNGEEVIIEFTADKTGTFIFFCSVPCGKGHSKMNGKLIVK